MHAVGLENETEENSFMKSLETALRFGAPLIVMDVDKVDPILNNVLNRETHKSCSTATTTSYEQCEWKP